MARGLREDSHEQRTSTECSTGRIRSAHAVASLSRTATCGMACTTRCLEGAAIRLQGEVSTCLRTEGSVFGRTPDPGCDWRSVAPDLRREDQLVILLDLVRPLVAADADCRRPGDAGGVGAGYEA